MKGLVTTKLNPTMKVIPVKTSFFESFVCVTEFERN